jgi:hypothetical protein
MREGMISLISSSRVESIKSICGESPEPLLCHVHAYTEANVNNKVMQGRVQKLRKGLHLANVQGIVSVGWVAFFSFHHRLGHFIVSAVYDSPVMRFAFIMIS